MNIDERLEALAQTVELLAGMQIKTEAQVEQLAAQMEKLSAQMEKLGARNTQMMEMMTRLGNIVIDHEDRLNRLEGERSDRPSQN